ncbi:NAD(+) diphosphatase [Aquisalimonas asiatica]|uniref:NAD(+) diphosphatase n=1 Tax=Aquisalimonas asiatica TaxID=406100 RepID=UPI001C0B1CC6|nr:NAD(+) diphosphatase [Aquisalimonas asiatica]
MEIPAFELQLPFEIGVEPPVIGEEPAWWFVFQDSNLVLERIDERRVRPLFQRQDPRPDSPPPDTAHFLGRLDGIPCFAADLHGGLPDTTLIARGLFVLHHRMDTDLFLLAGRAFQILEWDRKHRYCGRCGTPTERATTQRARICPNCEFTQFPRLTPAMMVLVRRGRQLLLAHAPRYPDGFYSVLAGFTEPGETLEACVRREVREEVGLEVRNIRYFASQSWPFPHSLMVAYVADWASGEIRIDDEEITHADWFDPDNLPDIPGEMSIAGHLIRWFVEEQRAGNTEPGPS